MSDRSALLQDVLADREADALLLLVTHQRQVGVKEIVRGVAPARVRELDDIDQATCLRDAAEAAQSATMSLSTAESLASAPA